MSSQRVVKRSVWLLPFALIAFAAYFQARGLSALFGSLVGSVGELGRVMGSLAPAAAGKPAPKSGRAMVTNNPFDSSTTTLALEPKSAGFSDPLSWPACEGVQVLIVTESSDPWWSLTTLREGSEPRGRLRRLGDGVAGKQVAFIGYNPRRQAPAVWLEGNGSSCQSMLFSPPQAASSRGPTESPLASALMRSVRVVPEKQDGAIVGLKLLGIKPGSLLGAVGLQSGDRLESINGFSMSSPEKALQAYAQLRTAQRLNVLLRRRGQPVELTLNIN